MLNDGLEEESRMDRLLRCYKLSLDAGSGMEREDYI